MKLLTLNFLTCAVKSCKTSPASFPLHIRDAELEIAEVEFQPEFLQNILPRLDIAAIKSAANDLGIPVPDLPEDSNATITKGASENDQGAMDVEMGDAVAEKPAEGSGMEVERSEEDWRKLHRLLLETQIEVGTLVCGNCQHEYKIMEGIPNFLLPPHLV